MNATETMLVTVLVTLWRDLTSPRTAERIRRGPHVALIEQALQQVGIDPHTWEP